MVHGGHNIEQRYIKETSPYIYTVTVILKITLPGEFDNVATVYMY
jgi:hypothetical protein